jgi:RND family efflux transporter MFP subunit
LSIQEKAAVAPAEDALKYPPRPRLRPLLTFFAIVALVVIIAMVAGLLPRLRREQSLQAAVDTNRDQLPVVNVTAAREAPPNSALELPGDLQALIDTPIYARADGYLIKRNVDIGYKVKTGDVLAELEAPELDQQILQARAVISNSRSALKELEAALALANANLKLAQKTSERWSQLEKQGIVSHQDTDEKNSNLDVRKAELEAARAKIVSARDLVTANEASLRRLEQMKGYLRITAPFDGMITARNVDVGTLINSGNGGAAKELFRVAQTDPMRIFVNVPQSYAGSIKVGQKTELRVQEMPGKVFQAEVARFTHAIDTESRSMLAVLLVPNPQGILLPGTYAQVKFPIGRPVKSVLIPGDSLIVGSKGTRVATVDASNHVKMRDIIVGTDYGSEVRIDSGIETQTTIVLRQLPRNKRIINAVSIAATTASFNTPLMAARTKMDWSNNRLIFRAGGRVD